MGIIKGNEKLGQVRPLTEYAVEGETLSSGCGLGNTQKRMVTEASSNNSGMN